MKLLDARCHLLCSSMSITNTTRPCNDFYYSRKLNIAFSVVSLIVSLFNLIYSLYPREEYEFYILTGYRVKLMRKHWFEWVNQTV